MTAGTVMTILGPVLAAELGIVEALRTGPHATAGACLGDRLMLGQDLGRSDYFRSRGGSPGMGYLMDVFVPRLRRRIGDPATDALLIDNPARAFSIAAITANEESVA